MCTLSYIFACISPITKNVGAILIQNEDLNALQITYYRYHTLSDTMSICLNGIYYTSVQRSPKAMAAKIHINATTMMKRNFNL